MRAKKKIVIIGGSRGLGYEYLKFICAQPDFRADILLVARNLKDLNQVKSDLETKEISVFIQSFDLSLKKDQNELMKKIFSFQPKYLNYFPGGGPYGAYEKHKWSSHQWAIEVSFYFPALLLHNIMSDKAFNLEQVTFIGSAIAESNPDPKASSYSASKHALFGLLSSIHVETSALDLRLYSPGYMETKLLPKAEALRSQGFKVLKPCEVAKDLFLWQKQVVTDFHRVFNKN